MDIEKPKPRGDLVSIASWRFKLVGGFIGSDLTLTDEMNTISIHYLSSLRDRSSRRPHVVIDIEIHKEGKTVDNYQKVERIGKTSILKRQNETNKDAWENVWPRQIEKQSDKEG